VSSRPPEVRQTIVQLLSSMGESREVRTYLQRFSALDQDRFAVIKVGGAVIRDRLEETASALAFLHTVGLTPVVIHGGGPQLDTRLAERGIPDSKIDGLRVTTPGVFDIARQVFAEQNFALVDAIRSHGVPAHGAVHGVFEAEPVDLDRLGLVGEPTGVNTDLLRSIVRSGAIPILACLGVAPGGQLLNLNADSATRVLVHAVQPMKIIFLTGTGGLLDDEGQVIDSINLVSEYEDLMAREWIHSGMRLKLAEIKRLLDDSPPSTSVSITTPSALARELFTHGGDGTLIRQGEAILRFDADNPPDQARLRALVESAFGRTLTSDWGSLPLEAAYVSDSYRAAGVITRLDEFSYLDKFAVDETARGEGLARTVWLEMTRDFPTLFWRSRPDNPFNSFYNAEADGVVRRGAWTIYWRGEEDFDRIAGAVKRLADLPSPWEEAL
jgi:bifunctional N-acetylglutamate synthase/kinase